jgi:hypothetical protein
MIVFANFGSPPRQWAFLPINCNSLLVTVSNATFFLANEVGLSKAKLAVTADHQPQFKWVTVSSRKRHRSYTDAAKAPLSGANTVPLKRPTNQRVIPIASVFSRLSHDLARASGSNTKSSMFDRLGPIPAKNSRHHLNSNFFRSSELPRFRRCTRCLSTAHDRVACKSGIRCHACFSWGHVAQGCPKPSPVNIGRQVSTPSRSDWYKGDFSKWFSLTSGPSLQLPRGFTATCNNSKQPLGFPDVTSPNPSNSNSKPQSSSPSPRPSPPREMAYLRANPAPFAPEGFNVLAILHRERKARAVVARPQSRNEDVSIVTINGMPDHEVPFNTIREVLVEFFDEHLHVPV